MGFVPFLFLPSAGIMRSCSVLGSLRLNVLSRNSQQKLEVLNARASQPRPTQFSPPFLPFDRLEALRRAPRLSPTVTRNGRTYREADNGRANNLVPAEDPLFPAARRAALRQGFERAAYMADHSFGSIAYGAATLANAPQQVRDGILSVGGLIDDAGMGASRSAPARRAVAPARAQPAPPIEARPNVRFRELNSDGQAMGVAATVTEPMLGTGTRMRWNPPGWQGNGRTFNEARAHLLAQVLGGSGPDRRNGVTMTHHGANTPQMRDFEQTVARRVRAGEVVEYSSTPLYGTGALPPSAVLLTAHGSREAPTARLILNPAGRRK